MVHGATRPAPIIANIAQLHPLLADGPQAPYDERMGVITVY
jgi:hypothetical protein